MLTFQEQGEAHADNLRLHGLQADMLVKLQPDAGLIPIVGELPLHVLIRCSEAYTGTNCQ